MSSRVTRVIMEIQETRDLQANVVMMAKMDLVGYQEDVDPQASPESLDLLGKMAHL